ncbi:MAG: squalene--hopene cyclase [Pirellulaceae bacterium]|nr:squalene--hopene cyclase [Pirellulaceae bacterium]
MALVLSPLARAGEPLTHGNVPTPALLVADEPFAGKFSLELAAQSLDATSLHWQKTRKCAACHTLPPYLMARPHLSPVAPELPEVRRFFETIVEQGLEGEPALPKDGLTAVFIQTAAALAFHDRATTGKLHPRTRQQLDRIWTLQREDGGWEWPFRDTPPIKSDEHYGVVFAALAASAAPESYLDSDPARKGLVGIRKYLAAHPPRSLHQKGMLLWAESQIEGFITAEFKAQAVQEITASQRPDGGWSLASLTENPTDPDRQTEEGRQARATDGHGRDFLVYVGREKVYKSSLASDGYATGFSLFVLRKVGVPADDPGIRRGITWLKEHQRASGRWFTPSQSWHTQHYISNAGTAYAILALHACGEIPEPRERAK